MNKDVKEKYKELFNKEIDLEKLNNVTFKIKPILFNDVNAFVHPNIKEDKYKIFVNSLKFKDNLCDSDLYMYISILHELEHVKTMKKFSQDVNYDYMNLMCLMEYISIARNSYLSYDKPNVKSNILFKRIYQLNYKNSPNELRSIIGSLEKIAEKNIELPSDKKEFLASYLKNLNIYNYNNILYYNKKAISCDLFSYFLKNTSLYIKKYPNLLIDFPILKNFFKNNGDLKSIFEIYMENKNNSNELYDKFMINLLPNVNLNDKFDTLLEDNKFKNYIEDITGNYNENVFKYYSNIEQMSRFVDENIVYENLDKILIRTKKINKILNKYNLKNDLNIIL